MNKLTLKAEKRRITGRKVKKLRRDGILPANVYGKKIKSESIQVNSTEFKKVYSKAGETGLIELILNGAKKPVLVHNVQLDPVSDTLIHADFLQVDLKEKVTAEVPVELIGESPAEKQGLGTVVQYVDEIQVEALPANLPDKFEVDISSLTEVDQVVYVKDLPVDTKNVGVKADAEQIVVKVEPPKKEEEIEAPAPTEGEAVSTEGEIPAEAEGEVTTEESPTETRKEEE